MFRRNRKSAPVDRHPGLDLTGVGDGYRAPVERALRSREQFRQLEQTVQPGPLRERLAELGRRVDAGVTAVVETARRATQLEQVVAGLDAERVTAELKQARRSGACAEIVDALGARFVSIQRLMNALDTLRERLPVLESRLATAVAHAAELALTSTAPAVDRLEGELSAVVIELEALSRATAELG
jgi:hypothetical protein